MLSSEVIGYFGFATSIIFFLSPVQYIYQLYYKKINIDFFSGVFLFLCFLHCLMWFVLGINFDRDYLFWCNFIGVLLNFIWCVAYINFISEGQKAIFFAYIFAIINISIEVMYFESLITRVKDSGAEGEKIFTRVVFEWIISAIVNTLMYFTPGFNIIRLVKTRDNRYIPVFTVYCGIVNSLMWLIYGCVTPDCNHVILANVIGFLLCLAQILVYYYLKRNGKYYRVNSDLIINPPNIDNNMIDKSKDC